MSDIGIFNLSLATVNCNSLNMSNSTGVMQKRKIYGITKLRADIILLSDLRLSNRNLTNNIEELKKNFRVNPYRSYNFLYHSSKNKRGVGMLINCNLNFSEIARIGDTEENFLAIKASIQGIVYIICSIYGPNLHCPEFFIDLYNAINQLGDHPVILGGDWNCTFSASNVDNNLDCLNMRDIPNIRHSRYLEQFCADLGLQDPFRILHPVRRDFSYTPFGTVRNNKSRLDFFLISDTMVGGVQSCEIEPHTQSKLFDHKAVTLSFVKEKKIIRAPRIFNNILNDPDIDIVVWAASAECYITHFNLNQLDPGDQDTALLMVGSVKNFLRSAGPAEKYYTSSELDLHTINNRKEHILLARRTMSSYPIELFHNFSLSVDDDIFMDTLLNNIRNEVTAYQFFINSVKKGKKTLLTTELSELKLNHIYSVEDVERMANIEKELTTISDEEISGKLSSSPLFDHLNNEKMSSSFLKLAEISGSEDKLSDIEREGTKFASKAERDSYIHNYYENLYKKNLDEPENL